MPDAQTKESQPQADVRMTQYLADALREVFGENEATGRFIDVSRIPLICRSITDIHSNLAEIKQMMERDSRKFVNQDQFSPVRNVVFGLVGLILTGFFVALAALAFRQ